MCDSLFHVLTNSCAVTEGCVDGIKDTAPTHKASCRMSEKSGRSCWRTRDACFVTSDSSRHIWYNVLALIDAYWPWLYAVRIGGRLFEMYVEDYAPDSVHKLWHRIVSDCKRLDTRMSTSDSQSLVTQLAVSFYGYILVALRVRGSMANQQMFYMSHVTKYHGLSRLGLSILSTFGWSIPISTYDNKRRKLRSRNREARR